MASPSRTVICVGDVHGYISKLESLWANLQAALPADAFAAALVIFLGDYNDRGPHTRRVLDFLLALPARHPAQRHVFLCGNHDLAFAAFVGALPPPPDGSPFAATWAQFIDNEAHEGWFRGPGHEDMHVQGRRWGGVIKERWNPKKGLPYKGSIYDAQPTFESYGVAHGSPDSEDEDDLFMRSTKVKTTASSKGKGSTSTKGKRSASTEEDEDDLFMPSTTVKTTASSKGKSSASTKGKSSASIKGKSSASTKGKSSAWTEEDDDAFM